MATLLGRFRGSLLGALLGDCIGAPFEAETAMITKDMIKQIENSSVKSGAPLEYTDDTIMANGIAQSIISTRKLNLVDMATRFANDYFRLMAIKHRGFSSKIEPIFRSWRDAGDSLSVEANGFFTNVFSPATNQFNGTGSIGNGRAMRVAPLALAAHKLQEEDFIRVVASVALLTHANPEAVVGTVLLALGIRDVLLNRPKSGIDGYADWLTQLGKTAYELDVTKGTWSTVKTWTDKTANESRWQQKLNLAANRLRSVDRSAPLVTSLIDYKWVTENLGRGVKAIDSVPTALFIAASYLAQSNESACTKDGQWRVYDGCMTAVSLGGDTDTIASMTGALLGASLGWPDRNEIQNRPPLPILEGMGETLTMADQLLDFTMKEDTNEALAKPAFEVLKGLPRLKAVNLTK